MLSKINVGVLIRDHFATFGRDGGRFNAVRAATPLLTALLVTIILLACGASLPAEARRPAIIFLSATSLGTSFLLPLAMTAKGDPAAARAARALCANVLFGVLAAVAGIFLLAAYSPDITHDGARAALQASAYFVMTLHVSTLLTILGRAHAVARLRMGP